MATAWRGQSGSTTGVIEDVLSPVGIAHLYRQLYFDAGAALGPNEQTFSIAPKEELEIVQEMGRRMSRERIEEFGSETTLENQTEDSSVEEISDSVQSSVVRDMSMGMSASAEGSIGVWSGGVSGNFELAVSTEQAHEQTRTRTTSQTRRSSEMIRKSYSVTVKSFSEFTERSSIKRTVRNETEQPISYALRRVMRSVRVKLQSIGPRLVWQLYVGSPGRRLVQSRLVMFREADPASAPDLPPNAPPRPTKGPLTGTQTVDAHHTSTTEGTITIQVAKEQSKTLTAIIVDAIHDAKPGGKATAPALLADGYAIDDSDAHLVRYTLPIAPGTASSVVVSFTVHYAPSASLIAEWEAQVASARALFDAEKQEEEFERAKRVVTAKSRVRAHPSADLRDEERYEILNRMVSEAFHDAPAAALPSPAEIEIFHRHFDVRAMFYSVHPSWWRPRYSAAGSEYEITEDSEPAPFGKSLGWMIQLDGDRRRNELLNSPWVRVCLPIRPGGEEAACRWLAAHFEGTRGFDLTSGSRLGTLISDIQARREKERLAAPGPDYVTLDGEVAPSREASADAYPVIDEFEVTIPTDGFVYEHLDIGE